MNYSRAQRQIIAGLLKNSHSVIYATGTENKEVFIIGSALGYIFPRDLNWIDTGKLEVTCPFSNLKLPAMTSQNRLMPTDRLRDSDGIIAREFIKTKETGECESVYIQEQYLKNFDEPVFYQELNNPKGTVLITEMDNIEGEIMTGFVAPMTN